MYSVTELPLYTDTNYRYTINLEGRQRTVSFYWNDREGFWMMDVRNADNMSVLQGVKLVPQHPIAADYRLEARNMTGYFILLPNNLSSKLSTTDPSVMPQFFKLFYINETIV